MLIYSWLNHFNYMEDRMLTDPKDLLTTPAGENGGCSASDGSGTTWKKLLGPCFGMDPKEVSDDLVKQSRDWIYQHEPFVLRFGTVIGLDETLREKMSNGLKPCNHFKKLGIHVIVKSDGGLTDFPGGNLGEQVVKIRADLPAWLDEMKGLGCVGTKFRSVYTMNPSDALCAVSGMRQVENAWENHVRGMVPFLEPEVLGGHDQELEVHDRAFRKAVGTMYQIAEASKIPLSATALKIGFIGRGQKYLDREFSSPGDVAKATVAAVEAVVPKTVTQIVMLSGGWEPRWYYTYLSALVAHARAVGSDRTYAPSASRALYEDPYRAWGGKSENLDKAREVAALRASASAAAAAGEFDYKTHEKPIEDLLGK
jgi:fructose-bisphosphate aldolase, class I